MPIANTTTTQHVPIDPVLVALSHPRLAGHVSNDLPVTSNFQPDAAIINPLSTTSYSTTSTPSVVPIPTLPSVPGAMLVPNPPILTNGKDLFLSADDIIQHLVDIYKGRIPKEDPG